MAVTIDGTSGLSGVNGSAATPALQGTDTNTGISFGTDTVNVVTGGSTRATVDSNGRLGVGETSPEQVLHVVGNGVLTGTVDIGKETSGRKTLTLSSSDNGAAVVLRADAATRARIEVPDGETDLVFGVETATTPSERMRVKSDGNMQFNGANTTTSNGNVGHIYKFFGGANNIIFPLESSGSNRSGTFEYRRTGRSSERTAQLSIGENSSNQGIVQVYSSGSSAALSGGVKLENGATSWSALSDIRLKNVVSHFDNALQDVSTLDAFRFTWKNDASETLQVGLSAQSVQAVLPEATSISGKPIDAAEDDDTEYLSVRYTEVIPLLVAALQESKDRIETLETRVAQLEGGAS